jgi:hypothetical protein
MPKNISTFLIGFFASICAVFVPRMVAMLNAGHGELHYFKQDYVLIGIAFAAVIGGITVIFEQGKNKKASETFMTALGIPALLASALNTGTAGNEVGTLQSDNQKLKASLAQRNNISIEKKASTIVPLEETPASKNSPTTQSGFSLINTAQAAEGGNTSQKFTGLQLGIQNEQTQYLIVLKKLNNRESAIQEAEELRKIIPKATAVQSDQNFLVIDGGVPLNESDALLKAIEFKNKTGLKPYLLQAK